MSAMLPVVGETWRSRGAPDNITVEILAVIDDPRSVTFRSTVVVGRHTHQAERTVALAGFLNNYELVPPLIAATEAYTADDVLAAEFTYADPDGAS